MLMFETFSFKAALMTTLPPPSCHLHHPYWLAHHATETYHCPHSSLHKPHTTVPGFLFAFLTPEDGTDMLSWNVGSKELPLLPAL